MNSRPEIISYQPALRSVFKTLNYEWLNKYFFVTEEDDKILSNPEKIIDDGGSVLFAKLGEEIVGTCALIKESEHEYEIAKMGVTEKAQGKKIGHFLMEEIIRDAISKGAKTISLDTAHQLKAAIALYTRFGFVQSEEERIHPQFGRKTFRMQLHTENFTCPEY